MDATKESTYLSGSGFLGIGGGGRSDAVTGVSSDHVKVTLGICEGEIEGIIGNAQGIYFDRTPLQNADGSFNFKDEDNKNNTGGGLPGLFAGIFGGGAFKTESSVDFYYTTGSLTGDIPIPGEFQTIETVEGVGVDVIAGSPREQAVNTFGTTIDRLEVTLRLTLQEFSDKGNPQKSSMQFKISLSENNTGFVPLIDKTITGRYPSPTTFVYSLPVSSTGGNYVVRVERLTPNSTDPKKTQVLTFASITTVISDRVAYYGTALAFLQFPAKIFQSLPQTWFKVAGIKIPIPVGATVDPSDRGTIYPPGYVFTGQFYTPAKASADPAWIVWYLLTNDKFYLGIDPEYVDSFALYQCSVYNNQLVSKNSVGGTERRFLFNTIIGTGGRENILEMIRSVCSTMAVKPYWDGSKISFWQDRPVQVLPRILGNADVEEGKFSYVSQELQNTTTVAKVSYQSPGEDWENVPEVVENTEYIQRYGLQTEEFALLGETRRTAAIRAGRRIIIDSLPTNTQIVATVRPHALFFNPGDVIQVADSAKNRIRLSGLVKSATTNSITLDNPVSISIAPNKKLLVLMPDGSTCERSLNTSGTFNTLTIAPDFALGNGAIAAPNPGATWLVLDGIVQARQYRVLSVEPTGDTQMMFKVTATTYDQSKYTQIEEGINPPDLEIIPKLPVEAYPPKLSGIQARLILVVQDLARIEDPEERAKLTVAEILEILQRSSNILVVSWLPSETPNQIEDPNVTRYLIDFKRGINGEWQQRQEIFGLSARWEGLGIDDYYVRIASVTVNDKTSAFVEKIVEPDDNLAQLAALLKAAGQTVDDTRTELTEVQEVTIPATLSDISDAITTQSSNLQNSITSATSNLSLVPVGSILPYGGNAAPAGFLLCNGSQYNASAYPALFDVIGTAYGGDGITFNVPDLRTRVPVGTGAGYDRGAIGGNKDSQLISHNHAISDSFYLNADYDSAPNWTFEPGSNDGVQPGGAGTRFGDRFTQPDGTPFVVNGFLDRNIVRTSIEGNGITENGNMQPYTVVNFIIKA
jgi:microcystin-dependent protein